MMQERHAQPSVHADETRLATLEGDEVVQSAVDFVRLDPRIEPGYCVAGTPMIWVVNRHPSRRIRVTIRTSWIYQDRPYAEFTDHLVHDRSDIRVGCVFPGPSTTQRFDREIRSAVFVGEPSG